MAAVSPSPDEGSKRTPRSEAPRGTPVWERLHTAQTVASRLQLHAQGKLSDGAANGETDEGDVTGPKGRPSPPPVCSQP